MPQTQNSNNLAETINSIMSGGGDLPFLHAPAISRNGGIINITNPTANGSYVAAFDVYDTVSGQLIATVTGTSYDFSALPSGDYTFAVKATGQNFEDSEYSNRAPASVYTITRSLTDLTANNATERLADGTPYTVTLTPGSGKYLPEGISVTMGGELTQAYSYDSYTGEVTIFGVTGNVVITAAAITENKLRRPAVTLNGSSLSVVPPRNAQTTTVLVNGTLKYTLSGTTEQTYDLSQDYTDYGIYQISASSLASGYTDSDAATAVYRIGAVIAVKRDSITLTAVIGSVSSFNVYVDNVMLGTISYDGSASWSLNMADYKNMVSVGKHLVELEAVGTGIAANRSNAVEWFKGLAPIYGVSGLYNSNPTLTRTDDSIGLTYLINSSSGAIESDFNNVFPWNKTEIVYTETGKFVSFPEMYFRIGVDSNKRMTDAAVSEWPSGGGNWYKTDPFLYGCYGASVDNFRMRSVSGVNRTNCTSPNYRTYARNNGDGYTQIDLYHRNILLLLWWIEFATKDSESVMTGRIRLSGTKGGESRCACGGTDTVETPSGFEPAYAQMRFHYIEDFIGNVYEITDGVFSNGVGQYEYVTADPSKFGESSSGKSPLPWVTPANEGIAAYGWDPDNPFLFMPIEVVNNSSYDTFFCDQTEHYTGVPVLVTGARYNGKGKDCGVSRVLQAAASFSAAHLGSRLIRVL